MSVPIGAPSLNVPSRPEDELTTASRLEKAVLISRSRSEPAWRAAGPAIESRPGCLRNRQGDLSVSADPEAGSGMCDGFSHGRADSRCVACPEELRWSTKKGVRRNPP